MVKLISENIKDDVFTLFETAEKSINIISPFISVPTAKELIQIKNDNNIPIKIITRFKRNDFFQKASSLEALKLLCENNIELYAVLKLHTKLYLIDETSMILGSSNFTNGGFLSNVELNVLFENIDDDCAEIIEAGNEYFNDLLSKLNNYKITLEKIENEQEILARTQKDISFFPSKYAFGYEAQKEKNASSKSDILSKYLTQEPEVAESIETQAWLKFEGFSDERRLSGEQEKPIGLERGTYKTYFPKRPRGLKNGDLVFIGVQSYDQNNNKTVMIYGYGIARKWNKNNEVTAEEKRIDPRRVRWPYYAYIDNFKYINKQIKYALPINSLLNAIGNNTYPGTIGTNKNVFITHCQKDKLKITDAAKDYLLKELSKLGCE